MSDYIYDTEGRPRGFRLSNHIYAMDGTPIGRVWAEKAYTLGGEYVGALINHMVLDKPGLSRRSLPPIATPPNTRPAGGAESRRPVRESFPDVFHLLTGEGAVREEEELGVL